MSVLAAVSSSNLSLSKTFATLTVPLMTTCVALSNEAVPWPVRVAPFSVVVPPLNSSQEPE